MFAAFLAAALATCGAAQDAPATGFATPDERPCRPSPNAWRNLATDDDRRRLRNWRDSWTEALDQARNAGHGAAIAAEGALLEPDAALPDPAAPPGDYACRTIKIGTPSSSLLPFVAYPAFRCRISQDGERLHFAKLTGSQRPVGRLFPDFDRRFIFLGTLQLGDEGESFQYGVDRERDMIGILERIGENRWRLVFPSPHFESLVDVMELTPATASN